MWRLGKVTKKTGFDQNENKHLPLNYYKDFYMKIPNLPALHAFLQTIFCHAFPKRNFGGLTVSEYWYSATQQ